MENPPKDFGPTNSQGVWRIRYSGELYEMYNRKTT